MQHTHTASEQVRTTERMDQLRKAKARRRAKGKVERRSRRGNR